MIDTGYTLGKIIGTGGMGVVYSAVQRSLQRTVAVKVPRRELAGDPAVLRQFRAEALAGSRINHRNVVAVFDHGEHDGVPYLVMQHVIGPRLGQILRQRCGLDPIDAADIARQILSALDEAHAAGVLHDDVKSDNILVETTREGMLVPRLIDFGLARFIDHEQDDTEHREAVVSGTPEYLAPEVIRGECPSVASDLYAVGIMLYEMITGATPYGGGTSIEIMNRHLYDDVVPMAERCTDRAIPLVFDHIVRRALAKSPCERFPSARVFRAALEQASLVRDPPTAPMRATERAMPAPTPDVIDSPTARSLAAITPASSRLQIELHRRALAAACSGDDPDAVVIACLDLTRAHVDAHALDDAICDLEGTIDLMMAIARFAHCRSLWRLQLTLAALYDGRGQRGLARLAVGAARDRASQDGSEIGCQRAAEMFERLRRPRIGVRRP